MGTLWGELFDSHPRQADEMRKVHSVLSGLRKRLIREMAEQHRKSKKGMSRIEEVELEAEEEHFEHAQQITHLNAEISRFLYQGDMALTVEQAEHLLASFKGSKRRRRQSMSETRFARFLWPNRVVPYTFDTSIAPKTRQIVRSSERQALAFWEENTCLQFLEVPADLPHPKLRFVRNNGCFSYVGRVQEWNSQPVSIGEGCEHFGVVAHEVAHALGFYHAQSRWDRDQFVTVRSENIARGYEDQFNRETAETNDNHQVDYDLGSVMHYSAAAFSLSARRPVLVAKEAHNQNTMGQRMRPSFLDVLAMNRHYSCLANCTQTQCSNGGYPHPKDCSSCICPWGFGGTLCEQRQRSQGAFAGAECGQTVEASPEWHELRGQVGNPNSDALLSNFSSCHWHIVAPEGRKLQLQVSKVGQVCSAGCFYGNVEFKMRADPTLTGIRLCCETDLTREGLLLGSERNLAVVSLYSRLSAQYFQLRHRYV